MKLNVMALLAAFNHHTSMARAVLDMLDAHGIRVEAGREPSHIGVGDLYSEREDAFVESHLAGLREACGIDGPEPEPITNARNNAKPSTRFMPPGHALEDKAEPKPKAKARKKRNLSPEARKRIADAQKKRWAAHHAQPAPVQ